MLDLNMCMCLLLVVFCVFLLLVVAKNTSKRVIQSLHSEFAMADLSSLNYFLGISVQRTSTGMFLIQSKYVEELLERANMLHYNPCQIPMVCLYMHDPCEHHYTALKWILRYIRGTIDHGIELHVSSMTQLTAYTNATGFVAKYHGVANVVIETAWLRNLLHELNIPLFTPTLVYFDNYADIFTKGLLRGLFLEFHDSMNVRRPPVLAAGEY
nr:hypothetical protein [Tanacetum cinerariifolium]